MQLPVEKVMESEEFRRFYETALAFCDFMENLPPDDEERALLRTLQQFLLKLYEMTPQLPEALAESDEVLDYPAVQTLRSSMGKRLPHCGFYFVAADPLITTKDDFSVTVGDLLDDLDDIYKDIKVVMLLLGQGTKAAAENALSHLTCMFEFHWSTHCINALWALHYLLKADESYFSASSDPKKY